MFSQKGFSSILIIFLTLIIAVGIVLGAFFYAKNTAGPLFAETKPKELNTQSSTQTIETENLIIKSPKPAKPIDPGWINLEVKSCEISLRHPPGWRVDIYEEGKGCHIVLDHEFKPDPDEDTLAYEGLNLTSTSIVSLEVADFKAYKEKVQKAYNANFKNSAIIEEILVDGSPGLLLPPYVNEDISYTYSLFKNKTIFMGRFYYSAQNPDGKETVLSILNSIKFTGTSQSYQDPLKDFSQNLKKKINYTNFIDHLKFAITTFKQEHGKLPDTLEELDKELLETKFFEEEYYDLSKYTYKRDDQKYTISVKLPNGTDLVVEGD